jgi:hypothetical protein
MGAYRTVLLVMMLAAFQQAQAAEPEYRTLVAPAGDLVVTEEPEWIRYEGPGLVLLNTNEYVIFSYEDQTVAYYRDDVRAELGRAWLKKGAVPVLVNGEKVLQASAEATQEACRCSQCVFFIEICCLPHNKYIGLCLGPWDCRRSCGWRRF